jgi:hypothetical protein
VRDLSAEVGNLERQAAATARLVSGLDRQLVDIDADMQTTTGRLARAQRELDVKHVSLRRGGWSTSTSAGRCTRPRCWCRRRRSATS